MFLLLPEPIINIWGEVFIIEILYISTDGFPASKGQRFRHINTQQCGWKSWQQWQTARGAKKGIPPPRLGSISTLRSLCFYPLCVIFCERLRPPPAPERPKQVLWALRGPSALSVYRTAQRAGDSNYQQMTVAVLNADQMAIEGIAYVQLCEGKQGLGGGGRSQDKEKQKNNKRIKQKLCKIMSD